MRVGPRPRAYRERLAVLALRGRRHEESCACGGAGLVAVEDGDSVTAEPCRESPGGRRLRWQVAADGSRREYPTRFR